MLIIAVLVTILACSRSIPEGNASNPPAAPTGTDTVVTYLAPGDSYTIGQGVAANQRFGAQTVAILRQQGIKMADPVYIAQTGWTTANLQAAIGQQNPQAADLVTLLIGVNDQYRGMDTAGYAQRFTQLLQKAVQLAKGNKQRVFVLSIPDYSVTPFVPASQKERVRKEIDWFNAINKRITMAEGISYTDITPSTRQAENNPALLAEDNLHPSGLEYKKWAEMLAPKMTTALR